MATPKNIRKSPPARTEEARESQLISLAMDVVEQRMLDGSASSQEVTHFLKLGSTKERVEREILERKKELMTAQTDAIKSQKRVEELYAEALDAMRAYSGHPEPHGDNEYND